MRKWIIVGTVVVVLLGCGWLAFDSTQPPSFHTYRKTAVQSAEAAHDALLTAHLTLDAELRGKTLAPYVSVVLDTCRTSVASAAADFGQLQPIDEGTATMRDQLAPLLAEAVRRIQDASSAEDSGDRSRLAQVTGALEPLAQRLDDFMEQHG